MERAEFQKAVKEANQKIAKNTRSTKFNWGVHGGVYLGGGLAIMEILNSSLLRSIAILAFTVPTFTSFIKRKTKLDGEKRTLEHKRDVLYIK